MAAKSRVVIVTGGRDYPHREHVWRVLDWINPECVVQGGCNGADEHARSWVENRKGKSLATFHAMWSRDGNAAGPIRNRQMCEFIKADLLLAFPGGRGTANCVRIARELGIPVME